jgi:hypothetical protein
MILLEQQQNEKNWKKKSENINIFFIINFIIEREFEVDTDVFAVETEEVVVVHNTRLVL